MAGKADIVALMADKAGISKKEAEAAYEALVGHLADALKADGKASLPGFGNFSTSRREARVGRNPRTNEEIQIPPSTNVKFKAGKDLKSAVNG